MHPTDPFISSLVNVDHVNSRLGLALARLYTTVPAMAKNTGVGFT